MVVAKPMASSGIVLRGADNGRSDPPELHSGGANYAPIFNQGHVAKLYGSTSIMRPAMVGLGGGSETI